MFWKEVSSAHQGCIYLTKNTVKILKYYYNFKKTFSDWICLKVIYFCDAELYFQHHYCSLQCHMIFRNHSNMLICCSRNISDHYQCWKQLCFPIILWKPWYILFFMIFWWIESSKEQHLFEIEIFCNIVFSVTFKQSNASLLNKSTNFSLFFPFY